MHSTRRFFGAVLVLALFNLVLSAPAEAQYLTVGSGCTYTQLQDAINATHGNVNEIHVLSTYRGKPVSISRKFLRIYGGYANCNDQAPLPYTGDTRVFSWLTGNLDTANKPVIAVSGRASLDLRYFRITSGHNLGGNGGGIQFVSADDVGHLELHQVEISSNKADRGAGIFFRGNATSNDLILFDDTYIRSNTADAAGGGIRLEGNVHLLASSPQTIISDNIANPDSSDGTGGGIELRDNTSADIGSPGFNGTEVIYGNHARNGGGISLTENASARLYTTVAQEPGRVSYNDASLYGGGIFLRDSAHMCVSGGYIDQNKAPYGAAVEIHYDGDASAGFSTTVDCGTPPGSIACPSDRTCNRMAGNKASAGAIVEVENDQALVFLSNVAMRSNTAPSALHLVAVAHSNVMANCELSGNYSSSSLVKTFGSANLTIDACTIAGNDMPDALIAIIDNNAPLTLSNSIVWQPGRTTLQHAPTGVRFRNLITQDANAQVPSQFEAFFNVRQVDPLFVNPQSAYSLQPLSPAVDYSSEPALYQYDLLTQPRGVEIVQVPGGPYDIGAYELQRFPVDLDTLFANGFDR